MNHQNVSPKNHSDASSGSVNKDNIVISVRNVSKMYPLYAKPSDRLRQSLWYARPSFLRGKPPQFFQEFWASLGVCAFSDGFAAEKACGTQAGDSDMRASTDGNPKCVAVFAAQDVACLVLSSGVLATCPHMTLTARAGTPQAG